MVYFDIQSDAPPEWWKKFLIGIPIIVALDVVWIGILMRSMYKEHIKKARRFSVQIGGFVTYAIVASAIAAFFDSDDSDSVVATGSLMGFWVFFVFNLTTYATNADWPLYVAVLDTTYGTAQGLILFLVQHAIK